jgi:hypothetical protein
MQLNDNSNQDKKIIAQWLTDSASIGVGSSSIQKSLATAFGNNKFQDIMSFATATFTHLEISQFGIPEDVLAKAQARALNHIGNKTEAVNMLNTAADLSSEQFNTATNRINAVSNFDNMSDSRSWAEKLLDKTRNMETVTGNKLDPNDTHNLKFGNPQDALVMRRDKSTGNFEEEKVGDFFSRDSQLKGGYKYRGTIEDRFGHQAMRYTKTTEDGETLNKDLTWETTTNTLMWGDSDSSTRYPIGRAVRAKVTKPKRIDEDGRVSEDGFGYEIRQDNISVRSVGDNLGSILGGTVPSKLHEGWGGKNKDQWYGSGGLNTINVQTATHGSLRDASSITNIPSKIKTDWGNYTPSVEETRMMSNADRSYSSNILGVTQQSGPIDFGKGALRNPTDMVRNSLGYHIDHTTGQESMRTTITMKDGKREYTRGGSGGIGPATGVVRATFPSAISRSDGIPDRQTRSTVAWSDDRAGFGEGEGLVLKGSITISDPKTTVLYGYTMDNIPFQQGDVFTKDGKMPSKIAEGSQWAGSMSDLSVLNFQFGNEAENRIQSVVWSEDLNAPVVTSVAGSSADIGEFKMTSGAKVQLTSVNESDPHFMGLAAVRTKEHPKGIYPDVIAPQASKDERMKNIALRMFQAEENTGKMRSYLRAAAPHSMNEAQFEEAFGRSGSINIKGGHGDIVADAASMYALGEHGVEYEVKGQQIGAAGWDAFVEGRKAIYGEDSGIMSSEAIKGPDGNILYYKADYKARAITGDIMGDWLAQNVTGSTNLRADFASAMSINQPVAFDMLMDKANFKRSSIANISRNVIANTFEDGSLSQAARDVRSTMDTIDISEVDVHGAISLIAAQYPEMSEEQKQKAVLQHLSKEHKGKNILSRGMILMPIDQMDDSFTLGAGAAQKEIGVAGYNQLVESVSYGPRTKNWDNVNREYFSVLNKRINEDGRLNELSSMRIHGFGGPAKMLHIPGNMHVVREEDMQRVLSGNFSKDDAREGMRDFRSGNMYGMANMAQGQRNMAFTGANIVSQEWLRGDGLEEAGFWKQYDKGIEGVTDASGRRNVANQRLGSMVELISKQIKYAKRNGGSDSDPDIQALYKKMDTLKSYKTGFNKYGADFFRGFGNLELASGQVGSSEDFITAHNKDFDGDPAPTLIPIPGLVEGDLNDSFSGSWRDRSFKAIGGERVATINKFARDLFGVLRLKERSGGRGGAAMKAGTPEGFSESLFEGAKATQGMMNSYQPYIRNLYSSTQRYAEAMGINETDVPDELARMKNAAAQAGDAIYQPYMDKHVVESLAAKSLMFGSSRMEMTINGMFKDGKMVPEPDKFGVNLRGSLVGFRGGNIIDLEDKLFGMIAASGMNIGLDEDKEVYEERGVSDSMARMLVQGGRGNEEQLEAIKSRLEGIHDEAIENRRIRNLPKNVGKNIPSVDEGLDWEMVNSKTGEQSKYLGNSATISKKNKMALLADVTGTKIDDDNYRSELRKYIMGVDDTDTYNIKNQSAMSHWIMSEVARNTMIIKDRNSDTGRKRVENRKALMQHMSFGERSAMRSLSRDGSLLEDNAGMHKVYNGIEGMLKSARKLAGDSVLGGSAKYLKKAFGTLSGSGVSEDQMTYAGFNDFSKVTGDKALVGELGPEIVDFENKTVIPHKGVRKLLGGLPNIALGIPKYAKGTPGWEESITMSQQADDDDYYDAIGADSSAAVPSKPAPPSERDYFAHTSGGSVGRGKSMINSPITSNVSQSEPVNRRNDGDYASQFSGPAPSAAVPSKPAPPSERDYFAHTSGGSVGRGKSMISGPAPSAREDKYARNRKRNDENAKRANERAKDGVGRPLNYDWSSESEPDSNRAAGDPGTGYAEDYDSPFDNPVHPNDRPSTRYPSPGVDSDGNGPVSMNINNVEPMTKSDLSKLRVARSRLRAVKDILKKDPNALTKSNDFAGEVADIYSDIDEVMAKHAGLESLGLSTASVDGSMEDDLDLQKLIKTTGVDKNYRGKGSARGAAIRKLAQGRLVRLEQTVRGKKSGQILSSQMRLKGTMGNIPELTESLANVSPDSESESLHYAKQVLSDNQRIVDAKLISPVDQEEIEKLSYYVDQAEGANVKEKAPERTKAGSSAEYSPNLAVDSVPKLVKEFHEQISQLKGSLPDTTKEMIDFNKTFNIMSDSYTKWNEEFEATKAAAAGGDATAQARLTGMEREKPTMDRLGATLEGARSKSEEARLRAQLDKYGGMEFEEKQAMLQQQQLAGGLTGARRRKSRDYQRLRESVLDEQYGEDGVQRRVAGATFEGLGAAQRGVKRLTSVMFASMMAKNQLISPIQDLASNYEQRTIAQEQQVVRSGGMSYDDVMNSSIGDRSRRTNKVNMFKAEMGEQIYRTYSGLLDGDTGSSAKNLGMAASIAGPAGAAAMAGNAFGGPMAGLVAGGVTAAWATGQYLNENAKDVLGRAEARREARIATGTTSNDYSNALFRSGDVGGWLTQVINPLTSEDKNAEAFLNITQDYVSGQNDSAKYDQLKNSQNPLVEEWIDLEYQKGGWGGAFDGALRGEQEKVQGKMYAISSQMAGLGRSKYSDMSRKEIIADLKQNNPDMVAGLSDAQMNTTLFTAAVEKLEAEGVPTAVAHAMQTTPEIYYGGDNENRSKVKQFIREGAATGFLMDEEMIGRTTQAMGGRMSSGKDSTAAIDEIMAMYEELGDMPGELKAAAIYESSQMVSGVRSAQRASGMDQTSFSTFGTFSYGGNIGAQEGAAQSMTQRAGMSLSSEWYSNNYGDQFGAKADAMFQAGDVRRGNMFSGRIGQVSSFMEQRGAFASDSGRTNTSQVLNRFAELGSSDEFNRAMAVASGDTWAISEQVNKMGGAGMTPAKFAAYNQIDIASGLGAYQTGISDMEMQGIQVNNITSGAAIQGALSNVDFTGGQMGIQQRQRDMQWGTGQYQYSYGRDMAQANFAMVTGGQTPLAGGGSGSFTGGTTGGLDPAMMQAVAKNFESLADSTEPVAKGMAEMGEIFDKYGFNLDQGSGLGQWGLEDAQRNLGRQQQLYGQEQQSQGLELQDAGRQMRFRQFFEQLGLSREQSEYGQGKQRTEMGVSREGQVLQEGYQREDWSFGRSKSEIGFGWQQEDMSLNLRYARGMQRRQMLKQQERAVISHSMDMSQSDRQSERMDTSEGRSAEAFQRQQEYFQKDLEFYQRSTQMKESHFREQFALDQQQFDMQSERHTMEMGWMQERWALEDQGISLQRQWYVFQYEQQEKMAEVSENTRVNMGEMSMAMEAISITSQKSAAQLQVLNKTFETMADLYPEMVDQILSIPAAHAEAGNKLVSQTSEQMQKIVGFISNALKQLGSSSSGTNNAVVRPRSSSNEIQRIGEILKENIPTATVIRTSGGGSGGRNYKDGGFTGYGSIDEVAGNVHRGEYVTPSQGGLVLRGDSSESLAELKAIRRAMEKLAAMGLYNINAQIYPGSQAVEAGDVNVYDQIFRS